MNTNACMCPEGTEANSQWTCSPVCNTPEVLDWNTNTCGCPPAMEWNAHFGCSPMCTDGKVLDDGNACACPAGMTEDANGVCAAPSPSGWTQDPNVPAVIASENMSPFYSWSVFRYAYVGKENINGQCYFVEKLQNPSTW